MTALVILQPLTGCPCGCADSGDPDCVTRRPILPEDRWPDYSQQASLHAGPCSPAVCGEVA